MSSCIDSLYVFQEIKLRGLVPVSYIHVYMSDFYIPRIGLPAQCLHCIWLQQNWQTDPGNICVNHECENWVTEHYNFFVVNLWAMQFHFWEYISLNQTFILDSHRTFICSDYQ